MEKQKAVNLSDIIFLRDWVAFSKNTALISNPKLLITTFYLLNNCTGNAAVCSLESVSVSRCWCYLA